MSIYATSRASDSALVDAITHGRTLAAGQPTRPAEIAWHLVIVRHQGNVQVIAVGPWSSAGTAFYGADVEVLWIRLKVGVYMSHLTPHALRDAETQLPIATGHRFYLHSHVWETPTFENADTFINRLQQADILRMDDVVVAAMNGHPPDLSARTLRYRFLRSTGLSHNHIVQVQRAQQAAELLRNGVSILDTVEMTGFYDQPHLTRSLKRYIGYTPAQLAPSKA